MLEENDTGQVHDEGMHTAIFKDVAKEIIRKSIRSAICIDDQFEEPYMSIETRGKVSKTLEARGETLDNNLPKKLYHSFRQDGECDLDIYNFQSLSDSWHPEFMLNNKDLVVLDWELEGVGHYQSTLTILEHIVKEGKIPFVILYTYKPESEFFEIAKAIISRFNSFGSNYENIRDEFLNQFTEHFNKIVSEEIERDDVEIFWEDKDIVKLMLEYLLNVENREPLYKEILAKITKSFNTESSPEKKFKTILRNTFQTELEPSLQALSQVLIENLSKGDYELLRVDTPRIGFRVNNCIVTFFSKPHDKEKGVNPENVFHTFSELISNSPHNFITLLSLEMRDRFREDFSVIGNEISKIDEGAFFHHMKTYKKRSEDNYKNEFYDFLLKSWANELVDYNLNLEPKLFETIDEYMVSNGLDKEIDVSEELVFSLADLATRLSTTTIIDRFEKDSTIRFGDLFLAEYEDGSNEYFLSITPHCVCVDACAKIENNFYFVRSESVSDKFRSALRKVEKEYYSFARVDGKIESIKWGECKPFTIYVEENDITNLFSTYAGKNIILKYVTSIKENFAQRIANKAFGYGTSIGIDLPHIT